MNDIPSKAKAARKDHSEYLAKALELMASSTSLLEKQLRLKELEKASPASESSEFEELYEKLAKQHFDDR